MLSFFIFHVKTNLVDSYIKR